MKIKNPTIGADIEYFVYNSQNKDIITAEGIIKGEKHNPFKFDPINDFYTTSLDNVLAEGNIPPAKTPFEFYQNIKKLMKYIDKTVKETNPNLKLLTLGAATLKDQYLQSEIAQECGCQPYYNCWSGQEEFPHIEGHIRAAGYHIHYGYDDPEFQTNEEIAKVMDLYLGIPAVIVEPHSNRKKAGYGQAGAYRHQKHGGEYRVLSSYFSSNKKLIQWSFNNTKKAIDFVNDNRLEEINWMAEEIQNTINMEDRENALKIVKEFKIPIPC